MKQFAEWLAQTGASLAIQSHEWVIPTIQSVHEAGASNPSIDVSRAGQSGRPEAFSSITFT